MLSRRNLFRAGAAGAALTLPGVAAAKGTGLKPITGSAVPISADERRARIAKAQRLMGERGVGALLVESGTALDYFIGVRWSRSERVTCALIPASGGIIVITPHFEEPSIREMLQVEGDVRPWDEADNPFERIAQAIKERAGGKPVAVESTIRFFIVDRVRAADPSIEIVSGDAVTRACRLHKSPAEIALMQAASDVTMAAFRWVHPRVKTGMGSADIAALMTQATAALGGAPDFALVLLNEASAFPHGSHQRQTVREGSVVLMDCGCEVYGYQSDISRTWVHGQPSARQRKVWDTVKRGQEIALEHARVGAPAGGVDDAVRAFYESEGWGPGYKLPGLSHRTGHGIGMDGHEPAYEVHGDATALDPGMCFSDEPGIYIPGEFGIRLEDCFHMTEAGPVLFSGLAKSLEDPI